MPDRPCNPVHVPTPGELQAMVVPRRGAAPPTPPRDAPLASSMRAPNPTVAGAITLSPLADALLREAVQPHHRHWSLERHWHELNVDSGSVKARVLNELRSVGFVRLEQKGREKHLHLYRKAYQFLGIEPPTGEGMGGATHKKLVAKVKKLLTSRGYTVYIEQEIGPARKRVDLVGYGPKVVGVEIGLTDPRQELKNLRDDLSAGALDALLFITTDSSILDRIKTAAAVDPIVASKLGIVKFLLLAEDDNP